MKKGILLAAVASVFGIATIAQAAPAEGKQWELTLSGNGSNDNDFRGTGIGLNGTLGYYLDGKGQHQVNVRQSLSYTDTGSIVGNSNAGAPGKSFNGSTAVGYDYHFDLGTDQPIVPFVGAVIGITYGDNTDDSITAGLEGGAKYYVNDTTFIFGRIGYDFLLKERFGDGNFNYSLGIGFRW